jgi:N-acetylmuramoyl-L-alanine amidase
MKSNEHDFFWDFFRDHDLQNRANKANDFNPHLTIIIHFNVDEKNNPWTCTSKKNYTMAFIGGAFTASDLAKEESKIHFLRLLLTDQLNASQKLAGQTVVNFNKNLNVPIARAASAEYLQQSCLTTSSPGVYCRNLVLCRKINSPLVYGESLYQDNENECRELMKEDLEVYGVKTNKRIEQVAKSYYEAILNFVGNN